MPSQKQELFGVTAEINSLQKAKEMLVLDVNKLKDDRDAVSQEIVRLNASKASVIEDLDRIKDDIESASIDLEDIKAQIKKEEDSRILEQSALEASKKNLLDLEKTIETKLLLQAKKDEELNQKMADIKAKEAEIAEMIKGIREEKSKLEEQMDKSKQALKQVSDSVESAKSIISESKEKNREASEKLAQAQDVEGKTKDLLSRRDKLIIEIDSMNKALEAKQEEMRKHWDDYNIQAEDLKAKKNRLMKLKQFLFNVLALDFVKNSYGADVAENIRVIEEQWK